MGPATHQPSFFPSFQHWHGVRGGEVAVDLGDTINGCLLKAEITEAQVLRRHSFHTQPSLHSFYKQPFLKLLLLF